MAGSVWQLIQAVGVSWKLAKLSLPVPDSTGMAFFAGSFSMVSG